jgi:hypothetical protein
MSRSSTGGIAAQVLCIGDILPPVPPLLHSSCGLLIAAR